MTVTGRPWVLEAGPQRATFDLARGGRLSSLLVEGHELIPADGSDTYHWGNFVLAPWVGRLRDGRFSFAGQRYQMPLTAYPNAIHGLVVDAPWQQVGPETLGVELSGPWPWAGRVIHSVRLERDQLVWHLELQADETMPAALGWHPWFLRELEGPAGRLGPVQLDARPGQMYEHGPDELPTGRIIAPKPRPWDDCFIDLAGPPRLRWSGSDGSGIEVTVESDCPCWVLYDEEPQAICVEPWTDPPDSLNLAPRVVPGGETLTASMTWRWKSF